MTVSLLIKDGFKIIQYEQASLVLQVPDEQVYLLINIFWYPHLSLIGEMLKPLPQSDIEWRGMLEGTVEGIIECLCDLLHQGSSKRCLTNASQTYNSHEMAPVF